MPYVYSTLSNDNEYTNWKPGEGNGPATKLGSVFIKGGTNVLQKGMNGTPMGTKTKVTREDMAILEANADFQLHKKNGFITVMDEDRNAETVVTNGMENKDASAPLTDRDFPENNDDRGDGSASPVSGKKKK